MTIVARHHRMRWSIGSVEELEFDFFVIVLWFVKCSDMVTMLRIEEIHLFQTIGSIVEYLMILRWFGFWLILEDTL